MRVGKLPVYDLADDKTFTKLGQMPNTSHTISDWFAPFLTEPPQLHIWWGNAGCSICRLLTEQWGSIMRLSHGYLWNNKVPINGTTSHIAGCYYARTQHRDVIALFLDSWVIVRNDSARKSYSFCNNGFHSSKWILSNNQTSVQKTVEGNFDCEIQKDISFESTSLMNIFKYKQTG